MPMLEYSLISVELALLVVVLWLSKLPYGWVISIAYGRTGVIKSTYMAVLWLSNSVLGSANGTTGVIEFT